MSDRPHSPPLGLPKEAYQREDKIAYYEEAIKCGLLSPKDIKDARMKLKSLMAGEDVEFDFYTIFSK